MLDSFGKFKRNNNQKFMLYLAGKDLNKKNKILTKIIKDNNLTQEVILFDWIEDTKNFFSQIDVHILTSIGEAFPNVICESMLNTVPCVSSNVGDVVNIIGPTGWVFEVNNYNSLKNILDAIFNEINNQELWSIRKKIARERIVNNYGIDLMMKNYYQAWKATDSDGALLH